MMWHVSEVQKKRRAFWSKHLLWELLMALCIGFVADGVVSYLGVTGKPATAVVVAIAYLGPRGIETFILAGLQRWKISSRGKSQSGE